MPNPDRSLREWLEERVEQYLKDLASLVNRDCGTSYKVGVDEVIDWIEARMKQLGASVERRPDKTYGDMILGRWAGKGKGRILLCGHADTVYPVGTVMTRMLCPDANDPKHLLGPGVADMKSGLLSGLYAVAALQALQLDQWEEVAMIVNSEEEIGSPVSRAWMVALAKAYDAALVLEPGRANGNIVTGRKGGGEWTIIVEGRAAHAGVEPEKGANAIIQLLHHAIALHAINGTIPNATVVVGKIKGGDAYNMVPPYAEMSLDTRALEQNGLNALERAIRETVAATEGRVPGTRTIVKGGINKMVMPRTEKNLQLFKLAQQSAKALDFTLDEQVTGGMSDGNHLAEGGIPVLDALGPVGGRAHSPDEYLELETIVPRTAMLAGLIYRLSQRAAKREEN